MHVDLQLWGAFSAGLATVPALFVAYRLAHISACSRRWRRQEREREVENLQRELLDAQRQLGRERRRKR